MNEHFYETGSTQPPKSRAWFVLLLVLLIFVSGIITSLSILNIRLWSAFSTEKEEAASLKFTREESSAAAHSPTPQTDAYTPDTRLGVATETVSAFMRVYYQLPKGVYFPRVPEGSHAEAAGILPGDILLSLDGQRITDTDTLNALLRRYRAGDVVTLTLHRDGQELSAELPLT